VVRTLAARVTLVTCATAVISVLVTALVAFPVASRSANDEARAGLADKADLAGEVLAAARPAQRERLVQRLRGERIAVYLVRRGVADRAGLPVAVVRDVAAGRSVDTRAVVDQRAVLVSARPFPGNQTGVVLTREVSRGAALRVVASLWLALLAGLVCALLAGWLLSRLIARPIRAAADAAGRLSAGDRSVRLAVAAPTEVAELADALNQLAAALATSEGRQREFLLSVSHDLRTPLASIRGYAEALTDGVVATDDIRRAGRTMLDESDRLDRLISDLLTLARLEAADLPIDLVAVDLADVVVDAAAAWAPRCAAKGVELRRELPDIPVEVTTDPGRLRQVVDGLCENALRATPAGAPLVLAARADGAIEVRDGGPGFTDDDLAVAFERGALYERYRGTRKVGSGLGLALAARMAARLGVRIEAGHAPEGGARFTLYLIRT
jgi:signal transduction histidine kinase